MSDIYVICEGSKVIAATLDLEIANRIRAESVPICYPDIRHFNDQDYSWLKTNDKAFTISINDDGNVNSAIQLTPYDFIYHGKASLNKIKRVNNVNPYYRIVVIASDMVSAITLAKARLEDYLKQTDKEDPEEKDNE